MVKVLSREDHDAIKQAVLRAEKETDVELAVVVARASDEHRAAALVCGIAVGCFMALLLWALGILTRFSLLMLIELAAVTLFLFIPALRHLCLRLLPQRVLFHHAAQRAAAEYVQFTHYLPAGVPVVLLYVSLAERYVHIYSSREVRAKIPDSEWHAVVKTLTGSVKAGGLRSALSKAVEHAVGMLKQSFPAGKNQHSTANVRQID